MRAIQVRNDLDSPFLLPKSERKMTELYLKKGILVDGTTITDVDEAKGIITGYFSKFGNIDSDGDMIMPGAFKKSLSENYRRMKHLYQHDPFKPLSATKNENLILKEDSIGLHFQSTVSQTSWGKDAIRLHVDGVIDENSIGFKTIKSLDKKNYRELNELQLWEGSSVTWGANEFAQTTGTKSIVTGEWVIKKMDSAMKAIRNGKYENEELFDTLDIYFKQLSQLFIDLTKEPIKAITPEPEVISTQTKSTRAFTSLNLSQLIN